MAYSMGLSVENVGGWYNYSNRLCTVCTSIIGEQAGDEATDEDRSGDIYISETAKKTIQSTLLKIFDAGVMINGEGLRSGVERPKWRHKVLS